MTKKKTKQTNFKNKKMKNSGYKRENHDIILESPIPEQHRFIHNIDTSIVNMVDVENYTPTYSGDIPNFNTMDMMELKEFTLISTLSIIGAIVGIPRTNNSVFSVTLSPGITGFENIGTR